MKQYDVCLVGLGYIGIPTAIIFADREKKVLGVDVVKERAEMVGKGLCKIGEPDIDKMLADVVGRGLLETATAPKSSSAYIIAVPTPFEKDAEGRKLPDLGFVESAAREIAACVENGQLVILESTSPVGTTELIAEWIADEIKRLGRSEVDCKTLMFAHAPERILPGQMLKELVANDRIVGGLTPEAAEVAQTLYKTFCKGEVFKTDARTAEMAKLTENASRDVQIAFANELSIVCDKLGINVWELIKLANRHPRVHILNPGPGVGGHCIAVDPWFIISAAEKETPLMHTARNVNDAKPFWVLEKVYDACRKSGKAEPVVACLGVTFKANVNDIRESPSMEIAEELAKSKKARVIVVDTHIEKLPPKLEKICEKGDIASAVEQSDVVLLLVDHKEFAEITPEMLKGKVLIDTKGFLSSRS